jgi:hypothetical protein
MAHQMGGAADAAMTAMMILMGLSALAFAARAIPVAWRGRIRQAIRRPAGPPAGTGTEATR